MTPLDLSAMPSPRSCDDQEPARVVPDGFVDDHVAMALVAGPVSARTTAVPSDLALAADDGDFAGWNLSPPAAVETRILKPLNPPVPQHAKRARAPEMDDPGIGQPHRGEHRWWVAALAGAFSTLLFTTLLLTLSSRSMPLSEETIFSAPGRPAVQKPAATEQKPADGPQLTGSPALR